jgi:hypothetical protein
MKKYIGLLVTFLTSVAFCMDKNNTLKKNSDEEGVYWFCPDENGTLTMRKHSSKIGTLLDYLSDSDDEKKESAKPTEHQTPELAKAVILKKTEEKSTLDK